MRILLMSVGATPQIVTETLFALAKGDPLWWPDRLIIITTASGAEICREGGGLRHLLRLLGQEGQLQALCAALDQYPVPEVDLVVPVGPDGKMLDDIRSEAETEAFADELLRVLFGLVIDRDTSLHVSLAGGRKTMSFLVGQVMSLLGRPQDRLSHVLLEPATLEANPDFWWPGDGSQGSEAAHVRLHEVAFLRLGAWLDPVRLLGPQPSFKAAITRANDALSALSLRIDLLGSATIAGISLSLPAAERAVLALVALAHLRGETLGVITGWNPLDRSQRGLVLSGEREAATALWAWLLAAAKHDEIHRDAAAVSHHLFDAEVARLLQQFDYDIHFGPPLSRLRRRLKQALPASAVARILPGRRLDFELPPEAVAVTAPAVLGDHPDAPAGIIFSPQG